MEVSRIPRPDYTHERTKVRIGEKGLSSPLGQTALNVMTETIKNWWRGNGGVIIVVIIQAALIIVWGAKLDSRVTTIELRGTPWGNAITEKLMLRDEALDQRLTRLEERQQSVVQQETAILNKVDGILSIIRQDKK